MIEGRISEIRDKMIEQVPFKYQSVAKLATSLGRLPPLTGDVPEYITEYDGAIAAVAADIESAKSSVYLEYFILTLDQATESIFRVLKDAVSRGVEVRVLFDWWGSRKYKTYKPMLAFLREHGIEHEPMLKFKLSAREYLRFDLRNHRKLIVVDQETGYVGSQNLIVRDYARKDDIVYDELVVRLNGSVVRELSALFAYDWSLESDTKLNYAVGEGAALAVDKHSSLMQVLPSGPSYSDRNNLKVFVQAINRADHEVFIANPYYVPPESLASAILSAAKRGVRVRMINSETMDQWMVGHAQRSYYDELLTAGVKIYLYKKPSLLHSKFMIIDNDLAIVGSSNLDIRSFELSQELSLIIYDEKVIAPLLAVRDQYLARSWELELVSWKKRRLFPQLLDSVARLTSNIQ